MAEPTTLSLILTSAIGGVSSALADKGTKAAPGMAERLKRSASLVEQPTLTEIDRAVIRAVDLAIADVRQQATNELLDAVDDTLQALIRLLDHPPFAEDVTRRLLHRGLPDFERLRAAYLEMEGDATSERWQALELYLADFFEAIEEHLLGDDLVGPLLRDLRKLASLARLEEYSRITADAGVQSLVDLARIARATEETAGGMAALLTLLDRPDPGPGEMAALSTLAQAKLAEIEPRSQASIPAQLTGAEGAYLRLLRRECNRLPLSLAQDERGQTGRNARPTELARVYVDLETDADPSLEALFDRLAVPPHEQPKVSAALKRSSQDGRAESVLGDRQQDLENHPLRPWAEDEGALRQAMQRITALEAMARHRRLVLLGDPGSGKSTLVNHLAYTLAGGLLEEEPGWASMLEARFETPLFPLRVILRRVSAALTPESKPGVGPIYDALCADAGSMLRDELLRRLGRRDTVLLLDGLDEAPPADPDDPASLDRRRMIVDSVLAICTAHPEPLVLVTSRVRAYERNHLEELPDFTLAPLNDGRIARFVERWHDEVARVGQCNAAEAATARGRLTAALASRPALRQMAGTPLLLTMLARVNLRGPLPEGRAKLYERCVNQLLWEWEEPKSAEAGEAFESLLSLMAIEDAKPVETMEIERLLWEMTFDAHNASGRRDAELPANTLADRVAALHPRKHEGKAWASRVVDLMRERSGLLIASDHNTFTFPHRSFQEYLAARWLAEKAERNKLAAQLAPADIWREVVLLACGHLTAAGRWGDLQAMVAELAGGAVETDEDRRRMLVAGQAWLEFGPEKAKSDRSNTGDELLAKVPRRLTQLMQDAQAPARQRLEAGQIAADLGHLPDDLDAFVPPLDAVDDDVALAKYPVTNAQFRRFWEDNGYDTDKPWWDADAVEELDRRWGNAWRSGPRFWDDRRFSRPTFPVVGVSWYEAVAYCAWLTAGLREQGAINEAQAVRLPTRAEWERAVRSNHGQDYPWGQDFDPARANTEESNLDGATPVHMYPDGATPEGIWDLAGNVWEWTSERHSSNVYYLTGGSWRTSASTTRASAAVNWLSPRGWNYYRGFRCCVAPI